MKVYYDATHQNIFDYLPITFHIKDGVTDREFSKFEEAYNNPAVFFGNFNLINHIWQELHPTARIVL